MPERSQPLHPVPPVPRYGEAALADLVPSLLAGCGVPGFDDVLRVDGPDKVCLLLVDGLGDRLLRAHTAAAPYLAGLLAGSRTLTAGFPSTTATSLASIGTGLAPGQHGMLGYQVAIPGTRRSLNALRWDKKIDPYDWQPTTTAFARAERAGVSVHQVGPGAFQGTGLTVAALRGARYVAAETPGDMVAAALAALAEPGPGLVYAYHSELDHAGHLRGCRSPAWRHQLAIVDRIVERLAAALPAGTLLCVTGDHGMVDVDPADRVDVDAVPALRAGVRLLAGESRARAVHARRGAAADVLARWQELLGDRAWVVPGEQAVADGWYGPVDPRFRDRIGDVVCAAFGPLAVVATRAERHESRLIGMHGSLTADEQLLPLLTVDRR